MANNRMYLVYRPTGDAVFLGKRLGWGWYGVPDGLQECVTRLYEIAQQGEFESGDDFALVLEQTSTNSLQGDIGLVKNCICAASTGKE